MIAPSNPALLKIIPKPVLLYPFEIFLCCLCVLSGVPYMVGATAPSGIEQALPNTLIIVWGFNLTVGGLLTLIGMGRLNPRIMRAGLSVLGPTAMVYSLATIAYVGWRGLFAGLITFGFGMVCLIKDYTVKLATMSINRFFREVDKRKKSDG